MDYCIEVGKDAASVLKVPISEARLRVMLATSLVQGINASQMIEGEPSLTDEEMEQMIIKTAREIPVSLLTTSR